MLSIAVVPERFVADIVIYQALVVLSILGTRFLENISFVFQYASEERAEVLILDFIHPVENYRVYLGIIHTITDS
jgi:hypothetical protein